MSAPDFLDTNVLVYAYDVSDRKKQSVAQSLVGRAVAGEMVISTQVLAEFSVTLLYQIVPPVRVKDLLVLLDALGPIRVIAPDSDLVRRGVEAHAKYGVHLYHGLIIAAAERAGSARIWSEDLKAGQKYFGVAVENPFV
jgi:predicted nucleic acid-binding protein